ncbi:DNA-binding transcriptional response regulator [Acidisphaera rubrifaciens]|uniref:response regulator n=1 Tax=Acidisphaera rubrifaciens TaxID=50715 RepID=UPI000662B38B|nr:response regulator [Acidisphaera rubrifaciens]
MTGSVLLAHDDGDFRDRAAAVLASAGFAVTAVSGSMAALELIEAEPAGAFDVLVTRMQFGVRSPNGLSLALMARQRDPHLRVVFTSTPENAGFADAGAVVVSPIDMGELLRQVGLAARASKASRESEPQVPPPARQPPDRSGAEG